MCYKSVPHFTALMRTFGNDLAPRTPLWPHPQQWESGGSPSGGQASDPDAEGDAQHGRPLLELSHTHTYRYFWRCFWQTMVVWHPFFHRCPCGCSSRSLKLKMVTTLEWLCRLVPAERVRFWGVFDMEFGFFSVSIGESVWAPDQHTHQDRSLPNPDLKVRVLSKFSLMVLHNYGNTDNFFAFFSSSPLPQILQREGRRSGQSVQTATRGQSLFAHSQLEKPNFREASLFFWVWHVCSVTGRLQTAGPWAGPVSVLWAPPHGPGHLQHICECVKR